MHAYSAVHPAALTAKRPPAHETESQLLTAARENRANARARLVEAFMPLIGSVARVYYHVPAVEKSELMQEGVVGVLRALERYDPELGTPFWAYASWWVRQAMQQLVSELSRPVVLSDRALRQLAHVRDARRTFLCVRGREPSQQELASVSDLTMEQLQKLAVAERQPRSLEEPVDARAGGTARIGDLLSDPLAEEVYEQLALHLGATEVPRLLEHLTGRERRVIEARYGLDGPERTLRELGEALGVSAERVRQIEQVALEKMRNAGSGECGSAPERNLQGRRAHRHVRPGLHAAPQDSWSGLQIAGSLVLASEEKCKA